MTEDDFRKLTVGVMPRVTIGAMNGRALHCALACDGIAVTDLAGLGIDGPATFYLRFVWLRR